MAIQRLEITGVRNILSAKLDLNPRVNVFYGQNGSGKSSVLEAAFLIGLGRSFRSNKIKSIINNESEKCTVFANISPNEKAGLIVPVGVIKNRDGTQVIKISNRPANSASALAENLPLQIINSDTYQLLDGSPKQRRQFIDWGVFHVEHTFLKEWKQFFTSLKQRNALLRNEKIDSQQMKIWTNSLTTSSESIDTLRREYIANLHPIFEELLSRMNKQLEGITLQYYRGWEENCSLAEVLKNGLIVDRKQGFTRFGPHRADLIIKIGNQLASEVLSRGQQKLLVYALRLAQGRLLARECSKVCCYLLDDLPSELDEEHQQILCELFEEIGSQVIITCVDRKALFEKWKDLNTVSMFHVEHGRITKESLPD